MIIVGGKNVGKKLVRKAANQLTKNGSVRLAVMSDRGVVQLQKAAQRIANTIHQRVAADAEESEIQMDGKYRAALIVTLSLVGDENA